jgi:hypothetical protein
MNRTSPMPRKRETYRAALVTAAAVLVGCGDQIDPDNRVSGSAPVGDIAHTVADSAGVRLVSISGPVEALPEWGVSEPALTEISGDAAPYIGSVGEVAFFGARELLVEDNLSSELRVFGADGREVRLLGGKGEGPGEFDRITQLSVTPGDTVYVFDYPQFRISVFGPDGTLLTTMPVPDAAAGRGTFLRDARALGPNRFLLFGNFFAPGEGRRPEGAARAMTRDALVAVIARDGTELASSIRFPGGLYLFGMGYIAPSPFSNHPFVATNGNRILYGSGSTYELVLRDLDLRPLTVIRWSGWGQPLTEPVLEAYRDQLRPSVEGLRDVPPRAVESINRMLEDFFRPELRPSTLPALGSAMLDEDGRIWVARFQPDFASAIGGPEGLWRQESLWHVLDPDGTPIARVRLPPATRLLAVRSDRIVVVTRDDLDVETVRVLAIAEARP